MVGDFRPPMFIAMDPPVHDEHRKTVTPCVSPARLVELEPLIRERAGKILDGLPRNETFNWLTACRSNSRHRCWQRCSTSRSKTDTFALLVGRHDIGGDGWGTTSMPIEVQGNPDGVPDDFTRLWNERVNTDKPDLISFRCWRVGLRRRTCTRIP